MNDRRKTAYADPTPAEVEADVQLSVDEALQRERVRTVEACKAVVLEFYADDWRGVRCLVAMEKVKHG